ncbi:T9SS type A sorting domain-containing protein [Adhaeribacter radiodurans]|uniref:T9SS type A sorting domain-containing protein n=1 Tax=Adhaeribacter radiodurans TaxID=2745197 RepID=A0A7L7LFA5_9BACT|nr:T9SS type A sorting domain-containing protein [Adhaeribacter radiodurans]QMU31049.1 T9SS type A sorting domain-containing protein [Adhaeribacter radiodurans]
MKILLYFFLSQLSQLFNWCNPCLILFLSLGFKTIIFAQNKEWDKTIGGSSDDKLSAMIATPDGGYILGGFSYSNKSGDKTQGNKGDCYGSGCYTSDFWVVKLSPDGTKEWDKTFGGEQDDKLRAIIPAPDGGYLLGGSSDSPASGDKSESSKEVPNQVRYYSSDYWLVKIDDNGKKVWDKTFGGDAYEELTSLATTPDGGFLIGGFSNSGKGYDKSQTSKGAEDYWIIKIDSQGKKIWDKSLGGDSYDYLTSLLKTPDGGYLLGGFSASGKRGNKSEASRDGQDINNRGDYWVVKIDAQGEKVWDKTLGGDRKDEPYSLLRTPDGGYLVGGYSNSNRSVDKSKSAYGYWVVKLKATGEKVWEKVYGTTYNYPLQSMVAASDGGYVLGGSNYYVVKIKEDGTKVWDKTFGREVQFNADIFSSLVATPDRGYLLGGYSRSDKGGYKSQDSKGDSDYWLIKIKDTNKITQTITITTPLILKQVGDAPFTLTAKASSGLPVTFNVVSGPATLKGNVLSLIGAGKIIIKISQAGNNDYKPAADVTQTIIVDNLSPVTKLWDKTFGGIYSDRLSTLLPASDGGYLLGGISRKSLQNDPGFSITKIDNNGKKEWEKDLGGDNDTRLIKGIVAADGGYLFGGSSNTAFFLEDTKFYIVKTSSDGTKEWSKTFWGPGNLNSLIATPDGGYLLGGNTYEYKKDDKTEAPRGSSDYWVVKIDANGKKLWDKTLGGSKEDYLTSLIVTQDRAYLIVGYSDSEKSGDKTEAQKGTWLVKLNTDGTKAWDKVISGGSISSLQQTSDNGIILSGTTSSKMDDRSDTDYWLVKLQANGSQEWEKTLGGPGNDRLIEITATPDGGYVLGGTSTSKIGSDKSEESRGGELYGDYWVVKVNATGVKVWDKTLGGYDEDFLATLLVTQDGNYLLAGTSYSEANGDKSEPSFDRSLSQRGDYWIVKIKEDLPLTAQWNMRYGGSRNEGFTSIIKTNDGGYLSGGYSASGVNGDRSQASQGKNDYWIVKSDQNGKKLWDKSYGGSGDDYLNRIIQTKDGGYLLAGSSLSGKSGDKTEASRGGRDYWIIKVDKAGAKEWDKNYGGSGYDELKKVLQLSTGEYLLAGYSSSPVSGDKTQANQGGTDYWLVKVSSSGEKLWDKRYGGKEVEELSGIVLTAEGGFLLGGSSWSGKSGNKSEESRGKSDFWLVAVDKAGKQLWDKTYGGTGEDEAYSLGKAGSTYFLAGQSDSPAGLDKTRDSQGGLDYWLLKVSSTGEKVWDKRYGGSKDDELRASIPTQDGGYLLAGKSFSNKSGNKRQDNQGLSDYWMVKADKDGQYEWSKTFGGSGAEELRAVIQTQEGGFLLGGKSDSGVSGDRTQPSQGGTDYWLVKVAPESTSIQAEREATVVEEIPLPMEQFSLKAYPNPSSGKFTVSFSFPKNQTATVKIFDNQGNYITTLFQGEAQADQSYQVEWQAANKLVGLYFLQLQTPTTRQQQKLLLTK